MKRIMQIVAVSVVVLLFSCSKKTEDSANKPAFDEARRDSVLAASKLPGARTVGKAIAISDSASARAQRLNARNP